VIRRFKLETDGETKRDCERQINDAVRALLEIEESTIDEWEVTDDVSYRKNPGYCARIVMKRKERNG
jgi:hypothetical protein